MEDFFNGLNKEQIEAVKTIAGPVLVVAGPGSGKTKCLTWRIAYMISLGIKPENILALTFTNKSAEEMKERVIKLLDKKIYLKPSPFSWEAPLIGTFHSVCAKILRKEVKTLGFKKSFTIYDEEDQLNLIKKLMEDLKISTKNFNPYSILSRISKLKAELIFPEEFEKRAENYYEKIVSQIYSVYQKELQKLNSMDFDDLIMLTVKIFEENPQILEKYQEKFKYILIDEYQDTNIAQYVLTKLLAEKYKNLFVIGDPDQSIYFWRNADFRNMLNLEKDFPEAKIIHLEQNYRSTKAILLAGQGIIKNNIYRHQKNLWTENELGEKVVVACLEDEKEEAKFIIEKIEELLKEGYKLNDFAILYRTHAQSRPIEEEFLKEGFPYKIIGALKFYERKEIKDIIAYLRILLNQNDIISFQRIYNFPPRGIGKVSFIKLLEFAQKNKFDIYEALIKAKEIEGLSPKAKFALYSFGKLLKKFQEKIDQLNLKNLIKFIIKEINYKETLDLKSEEENMRWENIKELLTVAEKFDKLKTRTALSKFLEEVALIQETDPIDFKSDKKTKENEIQLMTLHSAKGLEFPIVFIVGLEEGLLPYSKSIDNQIELEEERRLCYVGITRAKKRVFLSFVRYRNIFGGLNRGIASRFLGEIPKEIINFISSDFGNLNQEEIEEIDYL